MSDRSPFTRAVAVLLATCVVLLSLGTTVWAWNEDVHYVLTFWIASQAGLSRQDADAVAAADQGLDDSDHNAAIPTVLWIMLRGDLGAARDLQLKHFPTDAALPSPALRRVVSPNSPAARRQAEQVVASPLSPTTLRELGESLHPLQDSWSHQGVPDIPFSVRPDLISAHPKERGGWRSHDADSTSLHVDEVVEAMHATYDTVIRLLNNNGRLRDHPAKVWVELEPVVRAFAAAATPAAKVEWARKWIPEAERSAVMGGGLGRSNTEVTVLTLPSDISSQDERAAIPEPSVMGAARSFLTTWLTRHDIPQSMNAVDLAQIAKQLQSVGDTNDARAAASDWCRRVLTLFLVADHDVINRYRHADPTLAGYGELPLRPQGEGVFKSRPSLQPPSLLITDFVRTDITSAPTFALVLAIPGAATDTVTLLWQRVDAEWKIVRIFPLAD